VVRRTTSGFTLTGRRFFLFAAPLLPLALELLTLLVGHIHELVLKRRMLAEMVVNGIPMFSEAEPESSE